MKNIFLLFLLFILKLSFSQQAEYLPNSAGWDLKSSWNTNKVPDQSSNVRLDEASLFLKNDKGIINSLNLTSSKITFPENSSLIISKELNHNNSLFYIKGGSLLFNSKEKSLAELSSDLESNTAIVLESGKVEIKSGKVLIGKGSNFSLLQSGGVFKSTALVFLGSNKCEKEMNFSFSGGECHFNLIESNKKAVNKTRITIYEDKAKLSINKLKLTSGKNIFHFNIGKNGVSVINTKEILINNLSLQIDVTPSFKGRVGDEFVILKYGTKNNDLKYDVINSSDKHEFKIIEGDGYLKAKLIRITQEPEYKASFLKGTEELYNNIYVEKGFIEKTKKSKKGGVDRLASMAYCLAASFEKTGKVDQIVEAKELLDLVSSKSDYSFFLPLPFSRLVKVCKFYGLVTKNELEEYTAYADKHFMKGACYQLHNQCYLRSSGNFLASQVFPEGEKVKEWEKYGEAILKKTLEFGDFSENATIYSQISLSHMLHLAKIMGATDKLKNQSFRKMYERYQDQQSPTGKFPDYGDSGHGVSENKDWFMQVEFLDFVYAFEAAAKLFQEPSFRAVAIKAFKELKEKEGLFSMHPSSATSLVALFDAYEERDKSITPVSKNEFKAQIQYRKDWDGKKTSPTKFLLGNSKEKGSSYVLSDISLDYKTSHSHSDQHGAIDYFEKDGVMLLSFLGRNNWNPGHSNMFVVTNNENDFPFRYPVYEPNVWYKATIPTKVLFSDESNPQLRSLGQDIVLRLESQGDAEVLFDKMQLVGDRGEKIVIDEFDSKSTWRGGSLSISSIAKSGGGSLKIKKKSGVTFTSKVNNISSFDPKIYTELELYWRTNFTIYHPRHIILRFRDKTDLTFNLLNQRVQPVLEKAEANNDIYGSKGELYYNNWYLSSNKYNRKMYLTNEGVLIVKDFLKPTSRMIGHFVGPVWHMVPQGGHTNNGNWFVQKGDKKNLLIYVSKSQGNQYGMIKSDLWNLRNHTTTYAYKEVKDTNPIDFTTVIIPFDQDADIKKIASNISIRQEGGTETIFFGKKVFEISKITLKNTGEWQVIK